MTPTFQALATRFVEEGVLTAADVQAVAIVAPRFGERDPVRMLGLAFAVRAPRVGHAGVDLAVVASRIGDDPRRHDPRSAAPPDAAPEAATDGGAADEEEPLPWPAPETWQRETLSSPLVGPPDDSARRPFVHQDLGGGASLLLTRRMFREQQLVATALRQRTRAGVDDRAVVAGLDASIPRLFPGEPDGEAARAVRLAATRRLAIVIGGPGTGKTFSITRLLAALIEDRRGGRPLVIKLAAPTGKAAVRMREAIREATSSDATPPLDVDADVRAALQALEASTLHRLLGVRPDGSVRHGRDNPVPADVVVVDEVSMVDLALMRRLVEAVADDARLVLLGDRDQLASVEAGCVLADLVSARDAGPLAGSVQAFTRSRRFADAPDIALIAACLQSYATEMPGVPRGDDGARVDRAVDVFAGRRGAPDERWPNERVTHLGAPEITGPSQRGRPSEAQLDRLADPYMKGFEVRDPDGRVRWVDGYAAILARELRASGVRSPAVCAPQFQRAVLDALARYRVLAVHRRGPLGVAGIEKALASRVRESLDHDRRGDSGRHWIGRPILVTENAYDVALMNGDVGLVLPTPTGRVAVFPHERPGEVRVVPLSRLPAHEGALAMTVHKSQGSQFDRVALVLAGRPSPIQTRELVYTGVTRAKQQLAWLGTESELRVALALRVERASGLEALLREPDPG